MPVQNLSLPVSTTHSLVGALLDTTPASSVAGSEDESGFEWRDGFVYERAAARVLGTNLGSPPPLDHTPMPAWMRATRRPGFRSLL